ncbi:hypothetical protein GALMADRAFT_780475 [Galerina marginata CBS 339.88]|uniref:Uncharacterized protein n=1 Tax=Galerina marginata (strain CBS 339.88) TaxID=685588 RepID=A0A067SLI0_GALM3|nr:hypothetical protein GALMADRAFT_780475 [Galerina marginata CBS 339.88]
MWGVLEERIRAIPKKHKHVSRKSVIAKVRQNNNYSDVDSQPAGEQGRRGKTLTRAFGVVS